MTIISILWIPAVNLLSGKQDKRTALCICIIISSITCFIFSITGIDSFVPLLAFIIFVQVGISAYWTLYFSMMYDISELDEFISGFRREGTITALMSFSQKIGAAIATWLMGQLLAYSGYDAMLEIQNHSAQNMILYINTLIPGIFGILALIFALLYPLTGHRFSLLIQALAAKRSGKEYTTDGFKKLL